MIKENLIEKLKQLGEVERELAMVVIDAVDKERTNQVIEDILIDKINEITSKGV